MSKEIKDSLYMGIHYLETNIVSVMRITNLDAHLEIIKNMTQKYSASFCFIYGSYDKILAYKPFHSKLRRVEVPPSVIIESEDDKINRLAKTIENCLSLS